MQMLWPDTEYAKKELEDPQKKQWYFTQNTQNAWRDGFTIVQDGKISDNDHKDKGLVSYKKNPRTRSFDLTSENKQQTQNNILVFLDQKQIPATNMQTSGSETDDTITITDDTLPVDEYTFVIQNDTLTIAPNTLYDKMVHPMLLGSWQQVDSAGTLTKTHKYIHVTIDSAGTLIKTHKYIHVTIDSGHYKPEKADMEKTRKNCSSIWR